MHNTVAKAIPKVFLTFDVEDFINARSVKVLFSILEMLKKHDLKAIFFITGHMAEKLNSSPEVLDLLMAHEVGYHSSSHSVHPTIFEYTDTEKYADAYVTSLKRETSHIDPLSGEIKGKGGIRLLKELFPQKIQVYRAPGFYFSPPNLEAVASLGIKHDFSSNLSEVPVFYKGVTFYPLPVFPDCTGPLFDGEHELKNWSTLLRSISSRKVTVLDFHPSCFVNENWWDSIYYKSNPKRLLTAPPRNAEKTRIMLLKFERMLKMVKALQKSGVVEITPDLQESKRDLNVAKVKVKKILENSLYWPRTFFAYEPRFLLSHLQRFFERIK
jgi:peptidoglycan/xylan/chitin deacetylase (PgdA/CDA1 family)